MKKYSHKVPMTIGFFVSLISIYFFIKYLVVVMIGNSEFSLGILLSAFIMTLLSLAFYGIDAVISIIRTFIGREIKFNIMLAVVVLVAIPLAVYALVAFDIISFIIWGVYYICLFILEIISVAKHIKLQIK